MLLAAGGLTGFDGSLVSTSLVLVFGLLVVLCLIIMLEGKLFDSLNKKRQDAARAELDRSVSAAAPAARKAAPAPAPAVEAGIPGEVVAAIAAAVCCLEGGSVTVR
ncbi:MAG TPA: OadG family protein, partial [Candidatus Gemmiger faecigallinarum]|nr:OadG family protein [Candidatus Gemmiger faecigallinarum]